jgi:hypothetical protein
MFCVPFASTFVCRVALSTLVNKAVEAFLKPCQSYFFPVVLTMDGRNHVYIDLTVDISGCSHRSHNAPQTHDDSRNIRTCRLGQRLILLLCRQGCAQCMSKPCNVDTVASITILVCMCCLSVYQLA